MPDEAKPAPNDALDALLAQHWPNVSARLGERRAVFLKASAERSAARGFVDSAAAMRFANLCFAMGPGFEDKPENEWALALLLDTRLAPWVRLHQLVRRSVAELQRRAGDGGAMSRQLLAADSAVLDRFEPALRRGRRKASPVPRKACDLEAADLRVLDLEWRHEYRKVDGAWQRLPCAVTLPSVRFDAGHPAPEAIHVLSHARGHTQLARLQLRLISHAVCDQDLHPEIVISGGPERLQFTGAEARAVSWLVNSPTFDAPSTGLGVALVEETSADITGVSVSSCGVRDEGVPTGPLQTQVWTYPADQWMFALQREAAPEKVWPAAAGTAQAVAPASRCRIENDGAALPSQAWLHGFDELLPAALAQGFDRLFEHWQGAVQNPTMRLNSGLLTGRAALTWGWREGVGGLVGVPTMRVLGDVDLACSLELALGGEIEAGGARTAIHLSCHGSAVLKAAIVRERPEPPLLAVLGGVVQRFRFPFELHTDPYASASGIVCSEAGPCSGAISGEAGLRPRQSGGSGWQWYLRLSLEPVLAPIKLLDPVLGSSRRSLALLPALPLVDWSLG